jgi:hypothetical protein
MSFSALPFSKTYNNCYNISLPRKLHRNVHIHAKSLSSFSCKNSIHEKLHSRKKRGFSIISFDAKNSEPIGEDNDQALDAVMKLYSAFKNKNTQELSEILADECRCVCNFLSFFKAFQGKTVFAPIFSSYIRQTLKIVLICFSFIHQKLCCVQCPYQQSYVRGNLNQNLVIPRNKLPLS